LIAYGGHRQLVARFLRFARERSGDPQNKNKDDLADSTKPTQ